MTSILASPATLSTDEVELKTLPQDHFSRSRPTHRWGRLRRSGWPWRCIATCILLHLAVNVLRAQHESPGKLGVGSCAAAGCHGSDGTRRKPDGAVDFSSTAYSAWSQRDPHARAYDVLLNDLSRSMIRQLGPGWQPAHQNRRCLACHSAWEPGSTDKVALATDHTPLSPDSQDLVQDGVSCEACHGSAEQWLGPHTQRTWRNGRSAQERGKLGFVDLRFDLVRRGQTCAKCHVGGPGRDVDHDLIAAGHPRLNFEFSAYHANLPAHWSVKDDQRAFPVQGQPEGSALEAKLWLIGQLTAADAALTLLAVRAQASTMENQPQPWPEFGEYACYACHHDLQAPSWRQKNSPGNRKPGSYPWGTWSYSLLGTIDRTSAGSPLSEALRKLEVKMGNPAPRVTEVIEQSQVARSLIAPVLQQHSSAGSLTVAEIRGLLERITAEGVELSGHDWDAAAQVYLATVSLYQATLQAEGQLERLKTPNAADQQLLKALETMRQQLKFPQPPETDTRYTSPRTFDQQRIDVIRAELKRIESIVKRP